MDIIATRRKKPAAEAVVAENPVENQEQQEKKQEQEVVAAESAAEPVAEPKKKRATRTTRTTKTTTRTRKKKAESVEPATSEQATPEAKEPEGELVLKYDMHSNQRYVDSTSQKTDFEKMLDELAKMAQEKMAFDVDGLTKKHDDGAPNAREKKFEAFFGGCITNAVEKLYDNGYAEAALRCLEQARNVLDARQSLAQQMEEIKAQQEATAVDLSALFGVDGGGFNFGDDVDSAGTDVTDEDKPE